MIINEAAVKDWTGTIIISAECAAMRHSVDLPITAVSPRPCVPVLERSGAPQPAVPRPSALRSPITISPRPMKNCGSSAAARGWLGEFDTTSTTHCQIIAGGGLGKLTQFTDLQIFILFTVIGSCLAPTL